MLYRPFGRTGWQVSAIGLGCWNIGNQWGAMDDLTAERIVLTAFDHGVNVFDVAESYGIPHGVSELRLGAALRGRRDRVFIITKTGSWGARTGQRVPRTTPDMIRLCGHACCGRLRTDRLDLLLCHDGEIADPTVYIQGFEQLRAEGFVREYGISTNRLDVLRRFHEASGNRCAAVEVDYSLLNLAAEKDVLPYCAEQRIAVLVRGPLAKGLLSGRYTLDTVFTDQVRERWNRGEQERPEMERRLAALDRLRGGLGHDADLTRMGLRYVISHPTAPVAIPGATTPEQALANTHAAMLMTEEERSELGRKASRGELDTHP